jgi:opacity protein-like surface antigen
MRKPKVEIATNMKGYMTLKIASWRNTLLFALFAPLVSQSAPVETYHGPAQSLYSDPYPSRFYLKVDAGGNITRDTSLREFFGEDVTGAKVKFDPGYRIGVAAGYDLCQWFAVEGEVGSMGNFVKSITGADRVDALFYNVPFLVNAKLQAPKRWRFSPYLGGGIGGSTSLLSVDHIDLNGIHVDGTAATVVFAYQGFAGFRVNLNEAMGIGFEYRYFRADRPTWEADFFSGTDGDKLAFGQTETHAFSVVFDWRF